jgi:hypothetical protein
MLDINKCRNGSVDEISVGEIVGTINLYVRSQLSSLIWNRSKVLTDRTPIANITFTLEENFALKKFNATGLSRTANIRLLDHPPNRSLEVGVHYNLAVSIDSIAEYDQSWSLLDRNNTNSSFEEIRVHVHGNNFIIDEDTKIIRRPTAGNSNIVFLE